MRAVISPAMPPVRVSSCTISTRFVFLTVATIASSSSGASVRRSIDLDREAILRSSSSAASSAFHTVGAVRDDREVRSLPRDARLADRHEVIARRHLALDAPVQVLVLEEEHAVVVADRRLHQPLRVLGRRRVRRSSARACAGTPPPDSASGTGRRARSRRSARARPSGTASTGAVARRRDVVREHVVRARDEVDELHLRDRAHAHVRRAGRRADDARSPRSACRSRGARRTRACSPSVTLNAPPYAPMSSPRQKTFGVALHLLERAPRGSPRGT